MHLLFIVSASAGGCTGAAWVSSKYVVNFLPQLLCSNLEITHKHTGRVYLLLENKEWNLCSLSLFYISLWWKKILCKSIW